MERDGLHFGKSAELAVQIREKDMDNFSAVSQNLLFVAEGLIRPDKGSWDELYTRCKTV
jgi:hypothetical protein